MLRLVNRVRFLHGGTGNISVLFSLKVYNRADGALGHPKMQNYFKPKKVPHLEDFFITDVGCGKAFTVIIGYPHTEKRRKIKLYHREFNQKKIEIIQQSLDYSKGMYKAQQIPSEVKENILKT